jgi:hypothetical protein
MGMEHYYVFIDRPAVDAILRLEWKEFLIAYPVRHSRWAFENSLYDSVEHFVGFAVDPEPDATMIARILSKRTLRWTMRRATPQYWFMGEIITHIRALNRSCPTVWIEDESAVDFYGLTVAAVAAFIDSRIDTKTLWAIFNITGREDPSRWMRLTRTQLKALDRAIVDGGVERPVFTWQANDCLEEQYRCLRPADTRRFIAFLRRAWEANWPLDYLSESARRSIPGRKGTRRFRDLDCARRLVDGIRRFKAAEPSVIRYFG